MLGNDPLASGPLGFASSLGADLPTTAQVSGSATASATIVVVADAAAAVSGSATATAESSAVFGIAAEVSGSATTTGEIVYVFALDAEVSGSATATADGDIVPVILAEASVSGSASVDANADLALFGPLFTTTRRPPINLKLAARAEAVDSEWVSVLQVGEYIIPAEAGRPQKTVSQRFLLASVLAATPSGTLTDIEFRVVDAQNDPFGFRTRSLLPDYDVPASLLNQVPLDGAILSGQEVLQVRAKTPQPAHISVGLVANTREVFEVIA